MAIDVTSPAFAEDEMIPERYAKEGDDVFPALEWSGVPDDARELAVLLEDPDAPGGRFTHWEVAGINPSVRRLDTGELPDGAVQGRNDFGDLGYGGPHPPESDPPHRYVFKVIALGEPSGVEPGADAPAFHAAIEPKTIAHGELVGRFGR